MHVYEVLKRPVLTEKSNYQGDTLNRYTFEVDVRANKLQVKEAVEKAFNVKVVDVNVMNNHSKQRRIGRHIGQTVAWKKAIVTLAPGETISFL